MSHWLIGEQALIVDTSEGLVIVTGCAHPGILAIAKKVKADSPKSEIALVMGGFHLGSASPGQIRRQRDAPRVAYWGFGTAK